MAGLLATALLRTQDDERLAALAASGHAGAFDVLVSRHERALRALARRLVGPDAAEDVTQQALLRAWTAMQRGVDVHHARGWLHRIVRTTAIDHGQHMERHSELADDTPAPGDLPADVQRRMDVRHALALIAALPDEQRAAVLAAVQGRSSADVAGELGVSEGAVRQLAYRARAGLRAAMTAITPYPLAVWAAQRMAGEGAAVAAEAVGAGGSVLGGALLAKAGTVVVASGVVVVGATVPDAPPADPGQRGAPAAGKAAAGPPPAAPPARVALAGGGTRLVAVSAAAPALQRERERERRDAERRVRDRRDAERRGERPAGPHERDGGDRPHEDERGHHGRPAGTRHDDDGQGHGRRTGAREGDRRDAQRPARGRARDDRRSAPAAEAGERPGRRGRGSRGGRARQDRGRAEEAPPSAAPAEAPVPADRHGGDRRRGGDDGDGPAATQETPQAPAPDATQDDAAVAD